MRLMPIKPWCCPRGYRNSKCYFRIYIANNEFEHKTNAKSNPVCKRTPRPPRSTTVERSLVQPFGRDQESDLHNPNHPAGLPGTRISDPPEDRDTPATIAATRNLANTKNRRSRLASNIKIDFEPNSSHDKQMSNSPSISKLI